MDGYRFYVDEQPRRRKRSYLKDSHDPLGDWRELKMGLVQQKIGQMNHKEVRIIFY